MQKGSIMNKTEEKNNIDSKNTITNAVLNKDTLSHISQRHIADKVNNSISGFTVFSSPNFKEQDWITQRKILEFTERLSSIPLEYPLKETRQGNADENKKPVDGKALRITVEKDIVSIAVYTQTYGKIWSLSHTHQIAKNVFDAYALVVKNDKDVLELEKESKAPKNFSLNLG